MICVEKNGLRFYQFERFNQFGLKHGIFTRKGGVSPAPFDSLNMATTVGDTKANVTENLRRMFSVFDLDLASRYDGWQVHGTTTICTSVPRDGNSYSLRSDGLATDRPEVTLVQRFGDCVPVMLFDPKRKVIALYHAGWPGTVKKIGLSVISCMERVYGCDPVDLIAGIGPSIGPDHFVTQSDCSDQFKRAFPADYADISVAGNDGVRIDLWRANELTLREAGVREIEIAEICTVCHRDEWFSHRGDKGKSGRFGVLLSLKTDGTQDATATGK